MPIEPRLWTFEEFPASEDAPRGMKSIRAEKAVGSTYLQNVVYAERGDMKLKLQILLPGTMRAPDDPPPEPMPCIVFVQGSAWFPQDVYINIPQQASLAKRGFVLAVVEYRPSTVASFPAQIIDAKAAVRFIKLHSEEFFVDPDRVILMGDSSGGHTAVMAGITGDDILPCSDYPGTSASVRAVVDFFGLSDLSKACEYPSLLDHISPDSPEGQLFGGVNVPGNPELVGAASPMRYISPERKIPPVLIIHGDKDRIVPFNQSVLLYESFRDNGKDVEFYRLEQADHGSGEFWSDKVLDIVESFIRSALG